MFQPVSSVTTRTLWGTTVTDVAAAASGSLSSATTTSREVSENRGLQVVKVSRLSVPELSTATSWGDTTKGGCDTT